MTTYMLTITATTDSAQTVGDLIGPDGILHDMPSRLLGEDEIISSGCHFHILEDDTEPDLDDKLQALIAYLGVETALAHLEIAAHGAINDAADGRDDPPSQYDDKVLISQDAKDADREAGEKVLAEVEHGEQKADGTIEIRNSNGEIVRRIPRGVPAGGDRFA